MEDKEIIIDGVDVSKCRYFLKDTEGQDYETDEFVKGCCEAKGSCIGYEFAGYGLCRGDKDCYFKQLARKTQECEDLREALKEEVIYKRTYLKSLLDCKEECEALKSESFTREELITIQEKDIDCYRRAFEEIEKISHYGTFKCVDCAGFNCRACTKEQFEIILNIINKVRRKGI